LIRVETREVKHRGIRWVARDGDRTIAKGWAHMGHLFADFGEIDDEVMAALAEALTDPPAGAEEDSDEQNDATDQGC